MTPEEALRVLYRRAALNTHPDRGGDTAAMQRVNAAHEVVLSALGKNGATAKRKSAGSAKPSAKPRYAAHKCADCGKPTKRGFARCYDCHTALDVCPECGVRKYDASRWPMCYQCATGGS